MKKVLLSSLLKPADDVRMYQKLAISLLDTQNIQLVVVGRVVIHNLPTNAHIRCLGLFSGKRDLWSRIKGIALFWKTLLQERPETLINSSPDFLLVTVLYKILFGGTLAFDMRENHLLNLQNQGIWKGKNLWISTLFYKLSFKMALHAVDAWILAERAYINQIDWLPAEKIVLLENKFKTVLSNDYPTPEANYPPKKWCYTGTIAEIYGTIEAIELVHKLYLADNDIRLVLSGFCQDTAYWNKILSLVSDKPYITILGGLTPLPYSEIERVLRNCDAGILSYEPNNSFIGKIPTRYFELASLGKFVALANNLAFSITNTNHITNTILNTNNYTLLNTKFITNQFLWDNQQVSISKLAKLLKLNFI